MPSVTVSSPKKNGWNIIWGAIKNYFFRTDKIILLICILLSGASLLYLSAMVDADLTYASRVYTQGIASFVGFVFAIIISLIDYHLLVKLWKLILPATALLVILTFFIGDTRGNNTAWLLVSLGGFQFSIQPSEFLKIAFILTFSLHLSKVSDEINRPFQLLLLGLHAMAYLLLIIIQGDDGTALVFVGIFLILIFLAGIHWGYLLAAIPIVPLAAFALWELRMSDYQKNRILVLFWPDKVDPQVLNDISYQQSWGLRALGVGGIQGTGLFNGSHIYVPEMYNDFIFAFIGESTGLIGCLLILFLLLFLFFKILHNSTKTVDSLGRFICIGVFAMLFVQTIINLGMVLNVLPVIGVTLPFLSAGGTSVFANYIAIGLVLSVYHYRENRLFD